MTGFLMLNKLALNLTDYIYRQAPDLDIKRKDYMRYGIESILGEASKFILMAALFYWAGVLPQFFFSLAIFLTLRAFGGGYHFNHYWSCFFFTVLFFAGTLFYGDWLTGQTYLSLTHIIISYFLIAVFAPVPSKKRPINDPQVLSKHRRHLFTVLVAETIIALLLQTYIPLSLFASTVTLFTIQLMIGGFSYEIEKKFV
jgi:accessory gene regulator B